MSDSFEWDPDKARANYDKHGVSFQEASTVFGDPLMIEAVDREQRYRGIGLSDRLRLLYVVYAERGGATRIISAREATRRERKSYEG